jgi:hypothetical protein
MLKRISFGLGNIKVYVKKVRLGFLPTEISILFGIGPYELAL